MIELEIYLSIWGFKLHDSSVHNVNKEGCRAASPCQGVIEMIVIRCDRDDICNMLSFQDC